MPTIRADGYESSWRRRSSRNLPFRHRFQEIGIAPESDCKTKGTFVPKKPAFGRRFPAIHALPAYSLNGAAFTGLQATITASSSNAQTHYKQITIHF
jgi:hypothetical protein